MAGDIHMDTSQVDNYARAMKAAPQRLTKELTTAVTRITVEGQGRSRRHMQGHNDTGRLTNSLAVEPTRAMGTQIRGTWGTNVDYAPPVEEGRAAGSAMPPPGALTGWLQRHGIDPTFEFVVARAIARRGIPAVHFMKKAREEVKPIAKREIRAAVQRTLAGIRGRQ